MESIWKSGLKALVWANLANAAVWWVGVSVLPVPADFPPLAGVGPTLFFTSVGAVGAVAVYAVVRRTSSRPAILFRRIAALVLLLSFIPDLALLTEGGREAVPGVTVPGVVLLMVMHVVAAGVIVQVLVGWQGGGSVEGGAVGA